MFKSRSRLTHLSTSPHAVIGDMYREINSISQALNIGILVVTLATSDFYRALVTGYFTLPLFALTSLIISVIFWTRYHLDTEILSRSYTVVSVTWFFVYIVSQGVSISLVNNPTAWLVSTSIFLFFGFGFYVLNLLEIRRKEKVGVLTVPALYRAWQVRRMLELIVFSGMALCAAYLVAGQPALAFPAALVVCAMALWQLSVTDDYRTLQFIEAGA